MFSRLLAFFGTFPPRSVVSFFAHVTRRAPRLGGGSGRLLSCYVHGRARVTGLGIARLTSQLFVSPISIIHFYGGLNFDNCSSFGTSLHVSLFRPRRAPQGSRPASFFQSVRGAVRVIPRRAMRHVMRLVRYDHHVRLCTMNDDEVPNSRLTGQLRAVNGTTFYCSSDALVGVDTQRLASSSLILTLSVSNRADLVVTTTAITGDHNTTLISFAGLNDGALDNVTSRGLCIGTAGFIYSNVRIRSHMRLLVLYRCLFFHCVRACKSRRRRDVN